MSLSVNKCMSSNKNKKQKLRIGNKRSEIWKRQFLRDLSVTIVSNLIFFQNCKSIVGKANRMLNFIHKIESTRLNIPALCMKGYTQIPREV